MKKNILLVLFSFALAAPLSASSLMSSSEQNVEEKVAKVVRENGASLLASKAHRFIAWLLDGVLFNLACKSLMEEVVKAESEKKLSPMASSAAVIVIWGISMTYRYLDPSNLVAGIEVREQSGHKIPRWKNLVYHIFSVAIVSISLLESIVNLFVKSTDLQQTFKTLLYVCMTFSSAVGLVDFISILFSSKNQTFLGRVMNIYHCSQSKTEKAVKKTGLKGFFLG